jgi:hypothetical protein
MKARNTTWWERIALWWRFEGKYYHKDFAQGVRNLWRWLPVIWKDRDWDAAYVYRIMQFKLEQQAAGIGSRDRHESAQRTSEVLLTCARLCWLMQDGAYETEYLEYIDSEFEFVPTDETGKWYTMESTVLRNDLDEYFKRYPRQYKRVVNGEIRWLTNSSIDITNKEHVAMCIAYENQQRCRRLLFKLLEQRLDDCWD